MIEIRVTPAMPFASSPNMPTIEFTVPTTPGFAVGGTITEDTARALIEALSRALTEGRTQEVEEFYTIQRRVHGTDVWVDTTPNHYHPEGRDALSGTLESLRETFGQENVRLVRRCALVLFEVLED